ncbi:hypothetical protein RHSIM_Rhsim03G0263400 [Rhododendron simsii]|uniref:Uncharacterized protein n=1 Tax=Rhododendron simsii TaxID=118357 RepID=A0A834H5L1_RHOSS|nr:hypothetical protein RHSIM_Rhsim03G0263400 [Rhododendron simsii]
MSKSTGSEAVVPATIERTGMGKVITVSDTMVKMPGERSQAYEWTSKINREDKLSGSYERYTAKEKASRGEPLVEKGTGRVGVKDELQKSTTVKFGNKNGYREYHIEERLRDVNFVGMWRLFILSLFMVAFTVDAFYSHLKLSLQASPYFFFCFYILLHFERMKREKQSTFIVRQKVATPSISSRKTTLVVSASQDLKVDHSALQESSGRTRRAALALETRAARRGDCTTSSGRARPSRLETRTPVTLNTRLKRGFVTWSTSERPANCRVPLCLSA